MKEKFHFIRIKASRMNNLAQILFDNGYEVQGSDIKEELFTQKKLEQRGIQILPFSKADISSGTLVRKYTKRSCLSSF
ncbi:Mur ligase domain-containing protein [Geobacillus thermodenitrificans]|uniref:Mur ligase domain-containing protein n=1 Tax=Geobacillus thermodenitrificans TaxID=33940 RepID=UPI002E22BD9A|nr:Mur ligase domain-containing protein [Geobacillus thermodenitrificans]